MSIAEGSREVREENAGKSKLSPEPVSVPEV